MKTSLIKYVCMQALASTEHFFAYLGRVVCVCVRSYSYTKRAFLHSTPPPTKQERESAHIQNTHIQTHTHTSCHHIQSASAGAHSVSISKCLTRCALSKVIVLTNSHSKIRCGTNTCQGCRYERPHLYLER